MGMAFSMGFIFIYIIYNVYIYIFVYNVYIMGSKRILLEFDGISKRCFGLVDQGVELVGFWCTDLFRQDCEPTYPPSDGVLDNLGHRTI